MASALQQALSKPEPQDLHSARPQWAQQQPNTALCYPRWPGAVASHRGPTASHKLPQAQH